MKSYICYIKILLLALCLSCSIASLKAQSINLTGKDGYVNRFPANQVDSLVIRPGIYATDDGVIREQKSILETLRSHATRRFSILLQLIADVPWGNRLSGSTGDSLTLFAADDAAFTAFFASCEWQGIQGGPVRNYNQLTMAQKCMLLKNMLLEGAFPLRALNEVSYPTLAGVEDSVQYLKAEDFPANLSEISGEEKPWENLKEQYPAGVTLESASSGPIVVFRDYPLRKKGVTSGDVAFVLNIPEPWSYKENRTYVNGARIVEGNIACTNGYCHVVDAVAVLPADMPLALRKDGDTRLFSKMLERFCSPRATSVEGVFGREYDSQIAFVNSKHSFQAMFVPNDDAMVEYFLDGNGRRLIEHCETARMPLTRENLEFNLFQLPKEIALMFINNCCGGNFHHTVPSKYLMIKNAALDPMFDKNLDTDFRDEESYKQIFTKCLVTNSGVVYVMDRVMSPVDFASVMGPSIWARNTQIVKSIVRADDSYIGDNYSQAPLQKYYSTYLKTMQSRFSFFVPVDEGLGTYGYVDPISLASKIPAYYKYWRWEYRPTQDAVIPIRAVAYRYNLDKGQSEQDSQAGENVLGGRLSEPNQRLNEGAGKVKRSLFLDMIDQHIVVHDKDNGGKDGISGDRKYYTARSGAPVIILNKGGQNGVGMEVNGGFQWELKRDASESNDFDCKVTESYDMTEDNNGGYGNGMTYFLDRPMQPAMKSVYNVLSSDRDHYSTFFSLCNASFAEEDLILAGFKEEIDNSTKVKDKVQSWKDEQRKYLILTNDGFNLAFGEKIVRFLNNYRYTVYVPSNEAMNIAFEKGLMTHDEIHDWIQAHKGEDGSLSPDDKVKAKAMITMLVNFMKYHFQDQTFYVDKVEKAEAPYQTSCTDYSEEGNLNYVSIKMQQANDKIIVTDRTGLTQEVVEPYNIFARDVNYDEVFNNPNKFPTIKSSSYVVMHQVNKPLTFVDSKKWNEYGGRYDGAWVKPSAAKAFVAKYRIVK